MVASPAKEKPARRRAPWRDRKRALDTKDKFVAVRVTSGDHELLGTMAKQAGLKIGGFLRAVALGEAGSRTKRSPTNEQEKFARLLGEVGKIGSNVNQLARWCNTDQTAPQLREVERMRADIAAIREALMKALDRGD